MCAPVNNLMSDTPAVSQTIALPGVSDTYDSDEELIEQTEDPTVTNADTIAGGASGRQSTSATSPAASDSDSDSDSDIDSASSTSSSSSSDTDSLSGVGSVDEAPLADVLADLQVDASAIPKTAHEIDVSADHAEDFCSF